MLTWLSENWIELAGTLFALIYLFLSIRENLFLWVAGFLSALFFAVLLYQSRLYADMGLQVYYLWVSIYGWIHWRSGKTKGTDESGVIPTISLKSMQWFVYIGVIVLIGALLYLLLKTVPALLAMSASDMPDVPMLDSIKTAGSIVATWMLARKILEHWLFWIVLDAFSTGIYLYKGLYLAAGLFIVYFVMAVVGYIRWKRNMSQQSAVC